MDKGSHESMTFREGIDRMVDRASLAIGLNAVPVLPENSYHTLSRRQPFEIMM